ncbi:MAG TPA: DUF2782 domain-containing protein [Rhodanobacter sp.]|nr:DUF2782 domain-containing protein [Rhodanobacter sp.]
MKTNLLVAAGALCGALLAPGSQAQTYPAAPPPPPPGMNDPGVQVIAPPASSVAPPAATPQPDLRPLTLPSMKSGDSRMGRPSEPEVRIRQQGENTVQEFSRNGRVYMVVVTPKNGLQQTYLVDPQGRMVDEHGQRRALPAQYKVLEWGKSKPAAAESDNTGTEAPASSSSR